MDEVAVRKTGKQVDSKLYTEYFRCGTWFVQSSVCLDLEPVVSTYSKSLHLCPSVSCAQLIDVIATNYLKFASLDNHTNQASSEMNSEEYVYNMYQVPTFVKNR